MQPQTTFILLKPDAHRTGCCDAIKTIFADNKFSIIDEKFIEKPTVEQVRRHLSYNDFDAMIEKFSNRCALDDITIDQTFLFNKNTHDMAVQLNQKLVDHLMTGPVTAIIVAGQNAIESMRALCGATFPADADDHTIRGKFGDGSFDHFVKTGILPNNIIHAADSTTERDLHSKIWFAGHPVTNHI